MREEKQAQHAEDPSCDDRSQLDVENVSSANTPSAAVQAPASTGDFLRTDFLFGNDRKTQSAALDVATDPINQKTRRTP